jgi:hypothetical protein
MRRLLLSLAPLAVAACATSAPRAPGGAAQAGTSVPAGFEHVEGETMTARDLAHRGRPDVWTYTRKDASGKEVLLRKEKDLNGDGRVDTWERYEPDGTLSRAVYDLDFDGKADVTLFFEKDQLVRKELSFGFDGVPHAFAYYEKGKLVRKERDTNGDGKIDTWEYWENGEIDRIGVDLDGDGQVDRWEARKTAAAPAENAAAPSAPSAPAAAQK